MHAELCDAHYEFDRSMSVSPGEITEIINALPCNKSPGLDGLTSEHVKYASSQLSVLLSIPMSSILVHGRVPSAMLKSVMIPIVKNKNKHITVKGNYRPIIVEQTTCIFGVNRANCDTITKVGMGHLHGH